MLPPAYCLSMAQECEDRAAEAETEARRRAWLDEADGWRLAARAGPEKYEELAS